MQDERTPTRSPVERQSPWSSISTSASAVKPARSPARNSGTRTRGTAYAYWNNVETYPGRGYPADWQQTGEGRRRGKSSGGRFRISIPAMDGPGPSITRRSTPAPARPRARRPGCGRRRNRAGDRTGTRTTAAANIRRTTTTSTCPRLCNHCTHPRARRLPAQRHPQARPQDGIVLVDQDKCHGYRFCVEACPYKKVYFDPEREVATKCIFCLPRIEEGVAMACARQCPGRLRFVGYLDDPEGPIWKLVKKWQVALPLHPEHDCPNVSDAPASQPARAGTSQALPLAKLASRWPVSSRSSGRRSVRLSRRWTANATSAGEGKPERADRSARGL